MGYIVGLVMNLEKDCKCTNKGSPCCRYKSTPRDVSEVRAFQNRLNRMAGQLTGIGKMLEENRYCGDILVQVAAVQSALQAFGQAVLREHMRTCVVEQVQKGNTEIMEECADLIRKLK